MSGGGASKPRVLHLIHWPKSGITSFVKNLVIASRDTSFDHTIVVLIEDEGELSAFRDYGVSAFGIATGRFSLSDVLELRRIISLVSPQIIHSHSFQPGIWARLLGMRAAQMVTIHSCYDYVEKRSISHRIKAWLESKSIHISQSKVVCVSEAVKQHVFKYSDISPSTLSVIHNGIVVTSFENILGVPVEHSKTLRLVTVARLSAEKQLHVLLAATARCVSLGYELSVTIVGDGPERSRLELLTSQLGLSERVTFAGYQEDVRNWLWSADVYVCTSSVEGLPMSLLEAQAAGLPVVATNVGGIPEIIVHGSNGFLISSGDALGLAAYIEKLAADPSLRKRLAETGLQNVRTKFDIRKTSVEYANTYDRLLGRLG